MDSHLVSQNIAFLLLVASLITLITLSGCGCLSESSSSGSSEAVTTTEAMTDAYSQSGGTSVQSNQAISASGTDESSVKVTDSGTFTLSDSTITKTGETSSNEKVTFTALMPQYWQSREVQ